MPMEARLRNRKKGLLIILSAPSGTGKTTVVGKLLAKDRKLRRSISATTRSRRKGEKHGRDYLFLSQYEFRRRLRKRAFLESARVLDNFYGTLKEPVERIRSQGRDVVLVIDVQGARKVLRKNKALSIFLKPPSLKELARRLGNRNTDSMEEQKRRLVLAKRELVFAKFYDSVVVNRDIGQTVFEIKRLIDKARLH